MGPGLASTAPLDHSYSYDGGDELAAARAQGVNIMAFCKEYNAATQDKVGTIIPVEITVYEVRPGLGSNTSREHCRRNGLVQCREEEGHAAG